jgi:hypothetical protein
MGDLPLSLPLRPVSRRPLGRIEAALQRMRISWAYTGRREYIDQ